MAVATDPMGCPTGFNFLSGQGDVKLGGGQRGTLGAVALAALFTATSPTPDCRALLGSQTG
ncbi:MAG: hypothetical protein ABJB49_10625 [Nitrospirota bacterium]